MDAAGSPTAAAGGQAGLIGVQASFASMLESGLGNAFKSPTAADAAAHDEPFADATPRSVFATAKYFRVVAPQGLTVVAGEDPASDRTGQLAHGEVVEVLQVFNWEPAAGGAVEPRYRVAKGWVSAFDDAGTATLERMQVSMQEVRSRTWSEQKSSRPQLRRGASMPASSLSTVADENAHRSSSLGGDSDDGGSLSGRSRTSSAVSAGEGASPSSLDMAARGPPMLMGEWDGASAPCYAVPVPPPGSLAAPATVQVRAFVGLTSRRCGVLSPGEVVQVVETQMVSGATRLRFRGGWVTLLDKPRSNGGGTPPPLMEWTRKPPTKIASFRDPELLVTLADKVRQERAADQLRKRREREELATAALAAGAGAKTEEDERATPTPSAGRPLSGRSESMPNMVSPMVLTGLEPEDLSEALNRGNQLLGNGNGNGQQNATSPSSGANHLVLAKLYLLRGNTMRFQLFGEEQT